MYLRDNDEKYNVIPDKILVCGKEFIPKDSKLNYSVGSPFRYRDVHKEIIVKENSKRILILLPYEQNESFKIIDFLNKSNLSDNYTLHYKIHPNYLDRYKNYQKKIQKNGTIIKDNFVISDYKLIITKSSGSIIEYIAQGCTVIVIYDKFPSSLNPLTSSFGLGINYDYVAKPQDLFVKIKSIINKRKNINHFYENANFFKHQYFSSITDESIVRDLKSIEMTKNIVIKIVSNRNVQSAIDLIQSSEHTNRDKSSWDFNKMTALVAYKDSELIGIIPFEQHTIKIDQKVDAEILWITAAYIKPEYRSIGIGSSMDNEIKKSLF